MIRACAGVILSSDARMEQDTPQKSMPQHHCAGAYFLQFDCRGQMHQVVIPLHIRCLNGFGVTHRIVVVCLHTILSFILYN